MEDGRTDAEIAGGRCFTEAFRHGVEGGSVLFRAAIRYWTMEVSEGGCVNAGAALLARAPGGGLVGGAAK